MKFNDMEGLEKIDFYSVLSKLARGHTIYIGVQDDNPDTLLAVRFIKGQVQHKTILQASELTEEGFVPSDITLEEVLQAQDNYWYCYVKYEEIGG